MDQCAMPINVDQILTTDTNVCQLRSILDKSKRFDRTFIDIDRHCTLIHYVRLFVGNAEPIHLTFLEPCMYMSLPVLPPINKAH